MRRDIHLDGSANKLHHSTRLGTAIISITFASINTVDEYVDTFIFKSRPLKSEVFIIPSAMSTEDYEETLGVMKGAKLI